MDFVNKITGSDSNNESNSSNNSEGGLMDKLNSMAGGGKDSEKNEDYLDKGIDAVQQYAMGEGRQDNESAVEQLKDEQIADFVRDKYKSTTGSNFPVEDKK